MCDKVVCGKVVCDKLCVCDKVEEEDAEEEKEAAAADTPGGCRSKNKSPTQFGGERHLMFGPLLEIETSKKCTPQWREAHFQFKMYKKHQCRTTFGS